LSHFQEMAAAATSFEQPLSYKLNDLEKSKSQTRGLGHTLSKIEEIETKLYKPQAQEMSSRELVALGNELRGIRNKIESLSNMEVIPDELEENRWIADANSDLAERLKSENILNMSINEILQETMITWTLIFTKFMETDWYTWDPSMQWSDNLIIISRKIVGILFNKDRMMYVGIGIILLSAFYYFIFVTE